MTEQQTKKDLLEIKAFSDEICMDGNTYYDSHSRLFNIIRLPAMIKHLYPHIQRKKLKFEIRCFPDKESLRKYLETHNNVPLIVNLFEREEEIRGS